MNGLEITDIKIYPTYANAAMRAWAKITFNDCFVVRDVKIIDGTNGRFICMPSKKRNDGDFHDVVHPTKQEARDMIQNAVLEKFDELGI